MVKKIDNGSVSMYESKYRTNIARVVSCKGV